MKGRLLTILLLVALSATALHSSGVLVVAGPIGFNPSVVGQPVTWANNSLVYYTDQGDLSPQLPQAAANAFIADAFSKWTSVATTSLTTTRAGALAEDVSGLNVSVSTGSVVLPADIQPTATNRPLGVVYDADGAVTDALLGQGAGSAVFCASNSVYGAADAMTADAHFAHALLVLNGNCAQNTSDLPTLKYKTLRAVGRILGVGWSQINDNVRTGTPAATSADVAGFPLMHPRGAPCTAVTDCLTNYDQLRMDDRAAIASLYPGPQLGASTIRIRGRISFADERGQAGQGMQGVNVVARLVDPGMGQPSPVYVATSVSGFRFRGNNGNPITGAVTAQGEALAKYGSGDPALEGYYELSGLELPQGATTATYQLTLESLNAVYKNETNVGAAGYGAVAPSGSVAPIVLSGLGAGADVIQDIVMPNSARVKRDNGEPNTFTSPAPVPKGGGWWATLSDYGDSDFYRFHVRAGRTFQLRVTALDESFTSTTVKVQPVIGLWPQGAASGSVPLLRSGPFNAVQNGQTRLNASVAQDADLMLGVADIRGDGRPDFLYHARLLYADSLEPQRLPNGGGGPVVLRGTGFNLNTAVTIGGQGAAVLARTGASLILQPPALSNRTSNIVVTDLTTGDTSTITDGAQFGVTGTDLITIQAGGNPGIPVGTTARSAMRVRVTTPDAITPIAGAPVTFTVAAPSFFVECGTTPCTATTDALGEASATLAVRAVGEIITSASITNGAHVEDTVVGTNPALSIYAAVNSMRIPLGTTTSIPISLRVTSNGSAVSGQMVTFSFGTTPSSGSATFSASSVMTNSFGDAVTNVNVSGLGSGFTVLACLAGNPPCATVQILAMTPPLLQMQVLSGQNQLVGPGQSPVAVVLRVTADSSPPQPVRNAQVTIATTVFAWPREADCTLQNADCRPLSARPLATSFVTLSTDDRGFVNFTPVVQASWGAANIYAECSVGPGTEQTRLVTVQIFR